jgi:hypothetical protein
MSDEQADSIFTRLYTTKQGIVRSAVRSQFKGMDDGLVDIEGLCTDVWTQVLQALRSDGFEERGDRESNAWLRMKARGVASDFKKQHARHKTRIEKGLAQDPDMLVDAMPNGYAVSNEDKWEVSPDRTKSNPYMEGGDYE